MDEARQRLILLDLTRFFAAMAVLIFHYKSKYLETLPENSALGETIYAVTKFGYLGVDLFFLISGYVIFASSLYRSPWEFLVSRGTRIYPTLWTCVTLTALAILVFRGPTAISWPEYLANMTLFQSYLGIDSIDAVYWTLEVEIKFYGCIFVLSLFGWLKHYRIWLPIWLAATLCFVFFGQPFFMGWFMSPEYSPYFIAGIVFYLTQREGYNPLYLGILVLAMILAMRYAFGIADSFTHDIDLGDRYIVVALVGSFFGLFYLLSTGRVRLGYRRIYLVLGAMTYPLYLLHNVAGKLLFDHFRTEVPAFPLLLLITLIVMGTSYLINTWVEQRFANGLKFYLFALMKRIPLFAR